MAWCVPLRVDAAPERAWCGATGSWNVNAASFCFEGRVGHVACYEENAAAYTRAAEQCDDPVFRNMLNSLALQWRVAAREEAAKHATQKMAERAKAARHVTGRAR